MNKTLINLSIILPTINESENLKKLIPEIVIELSNSNIDNYEILILDDGSTDDTVSFIEQFNKTNSNVNIKNRISEPSLPMAIFDGIDQSKYDHVMWLDADGSMPAKTIREMVNKQAEQFDAVIIGSRFVEGGGYKGIQQIGKTSFLSAIKNVRNSNDSVFGMIASTLFNKLLILILSSDIKDLTSGFIIGKKEYFKRDIFTKSSYGEYFVYLVTHLLEEKVQIIELGYICETRIHGESKTASSLKQLVNRGIPYINAAIICRRKK